MFFGTNFLGQPPQQQEEIQTPEGYQSRVAPGSGQVMSGRVPQSVDMGMVPYANQAVTGVGTANTNGMPGMIPGLPPGVAPTPYVAPPQNPIEGVVEEAGTTGDPMVDGAIQQGMAPAAIPFREPMSTSRKLSALGMMMSAAGTDSFTRVAGTVQAGMAQDQASIEKYNRDLRAATNPTSKIEFQEGQYVTVTTPSPYRVSADGKGIEFIGQQESFVTPVKGGDLRDPNGGGEHAGGATGWREEDYVDSYLDMSTDEQVAFAATQGILNRPLNEFELKTIFQKNSAGNAGAIARATTGAEIDTENMTNKFVRLRDAVEYIGDDIAQLDEQLGRLKENPDRGGVFQPLEQFANQVLAEFGNEEALKDATNEQILESDAIQNMMGWFREQGLGARGLDTPAEFRAWLTATGGNLSMTNDAAQHFLEKRRKGMLRNIDRYNKALENPAYRNVESINDYLPIDAEQYKVSDVPPPPPGFQREGGQ